MKITLRQWRKEDTDQLVTLANNKKVSENLRDRFPYPYTLKDATEWIALNENKIPATSFVIEADGEFVGGSAIMLKDDVYRHSAEIGYWIGEPFWKKGIATETVRLLTEKIVSDFPFIIRVYAEVFEHNKGSMRALEKNGFHRESIRKKSVIKNNMLYDDHVWVKLLDK